MRLQYVDKKKHQQLENYEEYSKMSCFAGNRPHKKAVKFGRSFLRNQVYVFNFNQFNK